MRMRYSEEVKKRYREGEEKNLMWQILLKKFQPLILELCLRGKSQCVKMLSLLCSFCHISPQFVVTVGLRLFYFRLILKSKTVTKNVKYLLSQILVRNKDKQINRQNISKLFVQSYIWPKKINIQIINLSYLAKIS